MPKTSFLSKLKQDFGKNLKDGAGQLAEKLAEKAKAKFAKEAEAAKAYAKAEAAKRIAQVKKAAEDKVQEFKDAAKAKVDEMEKKATDAANAQIEKLKEKLKEKGAVITKGAAKKIAELSDKLAARAEQFGAFGASSAEIVRSIRDKATAEIVQVNEATTKSAAAILGFVGGSVSSAAKRVANAAKSRQYWEEVKAGLRPGPKR